MTRRSTSRSLLPCALLAILGACVAESSKTDTVVVREPARTQTAPRAKATVTETPKVDTTVPGSGTLNLRNPNFANMNVEVRIGANSDCAQNAAFGTRQLQRGAAWTITANQDVCWRRDANPDAPNGQWTSWNRQAIAKGTTHEATL